jgi:hypothetical protein
VGCYYSLLIRKRPREKAYGRGVKKPEKEGDQSSIRRIVKREIERSLEEDERVARL